MIAKRRGANSPTLPCPSFNPKDLNTREIKATTTTLGRQQLFSPFPHSLRIACTPIRIKSRRILIRLPTYFVNKQQRALRIELFQIKVERK